MGTTRSAQAPPGFREHRTLGAVHRRRLRAVNGRVALRRNAVEQDTVERPTTLLWAVVQSWRERVIDRLWAVDVVWQRALGSETGYRAQVIATDQGEKGLLGLVRIAVDASLTDAQAVRALTCALTGLLMHELRVQRRVVLAARSGRLRHRVRASLVALAACELDSA